MKYSDIKQSVITNFKKSNALPVFLKGRPGGGKSSLARDIVREMGIDPERVTEFNASLRDPVDIMGIPKLGEACAQWLPQQEFFRIRDDGTDKPCALILEEISDATVAMQNPLCRVILDRHASELKLHKNLYIIATGNRTEDKSGATRMTTKLANRMQHFEFEENIDDWSDWALSAGIDTLIIQFLRFRPNLLSDFSADRQLNPTPRTWEMVNAVETTLPGDLYFANVAGCVGEGAASEYIGFRRIAEKMPNPDAAILNPATCEIPDDPATLYAFTGAIAHRTGKDNFDRVAKIIERMKPEFGVMLVNDAQKLKPEIKSTRAFVEWAVKNANILLG